MTYNKKDFEGPSSSAEEIMLGREKRALRQMKICEEYGGTLLNIKLNIPGSVKTCRAYEIITEKTGELVYNSLKENGHRVLFSKFFNLKTGPEFIIVTDMNIKEAKTMSVDLEENLKYGRILDIDVMDKEGAVSRRDFNLPERKCLMCMDNPFVCRRNNKHTVEEIIKAINSLIIDFMETSD